jgi:hypothetical protein
MYLLFSIFSLEKRSFYCIIRYYNFSKRNDSSSTLVKHEKACSDNWHAFILFAFDTFDFLAPETMSLLQRVQKIINSSGVLPRATYIIFKRIGFAIQKGLAAQLIARLSFFHM